MARSSQISFVFCFRFHVAGILFFPFDVAKVGSLLLLTNVLCLKCGGCLSIRDRDFSPLSAEGLCLAWKTGNNGLSYKYLREIGDFPAI